MTYTHNLSSYILSIHITTHILCGCTEESHKNPLSAWPSSYSLLTEVSIERQVI